MLNVGVDYTFPVANGIGATLEYLQIYGGNDFLKNGYTVNLLGGMFNYPVSTEKQFKLKVVMQNKPQ